MSSHGIEPATFGSAVQDGAAELPRFLYIDHSDVTYALFNELDLEFFCLVKDLPLLPNMVV